MLPLKAYIIEEKNIALMERYSSFVRQKYKKIIVIWILIALSLAPFAPMINKIINYDVEVNLPNSDFQNAVNKINAEFSHKNYTAKYLSVIASYNYYIIIKSNNPYSNDIKLFDYSIREKIDKEMNKFSLSYYKLTEILLYQIVANYTDKINQLYNESFKIYNQTILIKKFLDQAVNNITKIENDISNILNFIYGPPSVFLKYYQFLNINDSIKRSEEAKNLTILTLNLSGIALNYFNTFYQEWIKYNNIGNYYQNAQEIIDKISPYFLENYFNLTKEIIAIILGNTNLNTWNGKSVLLNISLEIFKSKLQTNIDKEFLIDKIRELIVNKTDINKITEDIITKEISNQNSVVQLVDEIIEQKTFNESIAKNITATFVLKNILNNINYNPYFYVNNYTFIKFLNKIIDNNNNLNDTIKEIIINSDVKDFPIILKDNIKSIFIDETHGIFLIIVFSNHYPNDQEIAKDLDIFDKIKKDVKTNNVEIYITGISLLSHEIKIGAENALYTIIPLGLVIIFLIVSLYFRSFVAGGIVLSLFAIAIIIAFALNYIILGIWLNRNISFVSPSIVLVLTLGLCSDYSAYLLRRYQLERSEGKDKNEALMAVTYWSSRGVITSSLAVFSSYVILSLMNVPLFGETAIANAIAVASTMITSLLFFPSLLYALGDKVFWPKRTKGYEIKLSKVYEFNLKHKNEIVLLLTAITLISLLFVSNITTVLDVPPLMPPSEVQKGTLLFYSTIGSSISPIYIYVEGKGKVLINENLNSTYLNYVSSIADNISKIKEVKYVYTIDRPFGDKIDLNKVFLNETTKEIFLPSIERFIGTSNNGVLIEVIIDKQPFSLDAIEVLKEIRAVIPANEEFKVYVDGVTQMSFDSKAVTDQVTPIVLLSLITVIGFLLFMQLISVLIPIRLILTVLSSVAWSLALLYIVYHLLFNLPIINAVPLFLVVTMLGVGVDYDIFLLTRVREEVVKGKNDEDAIKIALEKTGTTIMILGLLLGITFLLLLIPNFPLLNEIGFAIGLSVLFDSFIIVQFFVPSIMLIAKKWNWWPSKIKR